jgi:hypothetical protein
MTDTKKKGQDEPWFKQVKAIIDQVIGRIDNPLTRAVGAGALTAGAIAATTAFGPIGVVGAVGWIVVYAVTGGTLTIETGKNILEWYKRSDHAKQKAFKKKIENLKELLDDGLITKEAFDSAVEKIIKMMMFEAERHPIDLSSP